MGHAKNGKGNAGGKTPWPNDWECDGCSRPGAPKYCYDKDDACNVCRKAKPANPKRYYNSYEFKNGGGNGGGSAGGKGDKGKGGKGGKGGQGGKESATAKKVREMQEEKEEAINLQQLKVLEAEKKAGKWGPAGAGNDEETAEKDDDLVIDVAEVKKELDEAEKDHKMWTARAKSRKEGSAGHDKAKREVASAEEAIEAYRTQLRDSKTPTQQMVGKCKRSDKLASRCEELAQKMLEAQREEEAALAAADAAQARYHEFSDEHTKAQEEIKKLARETSTIIGNEFDAGKKTKEMFASDCEHLRNQLLDPLLENDPSLKEGVAELQTMQDSMDAFLKRMAEVSEKVRLAQAAAAEVAAERANEAAKEASTTAATAVKTAAAPGAAAGLPGGPKPNEKSILSRQAARLRASMSAQGLGAWQVPPELAKPVHERTPEDAVAAAKASKIARTERDQRIAADQEMEADLADS